MLLIQSTGALASAVFHINNRKSDFTSTDPTFGAVIKAINAAADQIESTVNTGILSDTNRSNFLSTVASANASSQSGLGVDYGSNPALTVVGIGLTGDFNAGSGGFKTSTGTASNSVPAIGVGLQSSAMVGINAARIGLHKMGPIDPSRLMLYVNTFGYSLSADALKVNLFNFGVHGQYKLIPKKSLGFIAGWGGIDVGTGFEYSSLNASYGAKLAVQQVLPVPSTTDTVTVKYTTDYNLGVKTTDFTIPFEISTNVNFLYLFSLYFGSGIDLNFGKSSTTGGGSGPVTTTYSGNSPAGSNLFSATGDLNLDTDPYGTPPALLARVFTGVQLNIWAFKILSQFTYMSDHTYAGTLGLRFAL